MAKKDSRVTDYIKKSAPFAQEILNHFRALVHELCPGVEETIKWSFPHFDYRGMAMCSMASFKKHCAITFWKAALMKNNKVLVDNASGESAMGHLGKLTTLNDLPPDQLLKAFIKDAMQLNEKGIKVPYVKKDPVRFPDPPDYLMKALKKNAAALKTFNAFSPSNKKEYILWIKEAKTESTRIKRLKTAVEWMSEGKIRNWKYVKK